MAAVEPVSGDSRIRPLRMRHGRAVSDGGKRQRGDAHGCGCAKLGPGSDCMSCGLGRASSSFGGDRRRSRSRLEAFGAGSDHLGVGRAAEHRHGAGVCGAAWRCGAATRASPKPAVTPCSKQAAGQIEHSSTGQTVPRVALTCAKPPGTAIHSIGRAMARDMGVSVRSVQRVWVAHDLHPHRIRSFKRSNNSEFAAELEGHRRPVRPPPAHPFMLSIGKAFQVQVLDASQPDLPGKCTSGNVKWQRSRNTNCASGTDITCPNSS
jgi:hypothetical protein